ncbi:hypothetical protein [Carnimonas bestiolae]|uniref:hypothetical protein n=1 Tax=Carnimonas bestiolae TaxID=3402172 RepID=UPI003EDC02BE
MSVEREIARHAEEQGRIEDRKEAQDAESEKYWAELRAGNSYGGIDIEKVDEEIADCAEIGTMIREAVVSGNYDKLKDRVDSVINRAIDRELGIKTAA